MIRKNLLVLMTSFVMLIIVPVIGFSIMPSVTLAQTPPEIAALELDSTRLAGTHIYFSEDRSVSVFDRSGAGVSRFAGLLTRLGADLQVVDWRADIPSDADLVIVLNTSQFAADQVARLWTYFSDGGDILLFVDAIPSQFRSQRELFALLWNDLGINARDDVVVVEGEVPRAADAADVSDEATATPAPSARSTMPILVSDLVTTMINDEHPITAGLDGQLAFFTSRSLQIDTSFQVGEVTPLIFTPDEYYGEVNYNDYLSDHIMEYNIGRDTSRGRLPLAVAYYNPKTDAHMIVIGDMDFALNSGGLQTAPSYSASFIYPGNAQFLVRAVDWLIDTEVSETDLVFPTPGASETPTITPSPTIAPTTEPESGDS